MEIDYSPFLHVLEDGIIWWRLEDAIKLGAGYVPVRDNERNLNPVLRAKNNQVRANERTLLSEFSPDHYSEEHPRLLVRDDARFVEAQEFLDWLSQDTALRQSGMPFPDDLDRAVRLAIGPRVRHSGAGSKSLTLALEGYFDKQFNELPVVQRKRVRRDFRPIHWNGATPEQRRYRASEWDCLHDPAMENEHQYWWDFYERIRELEKQIEKWSAVGAPTATDLAQKENRLVELQRELAGMKNEEQRVQRNHADHEPEFPGAQAPVATHSAGMPEYIAYPRAMRQLADRIKATPDEMAAWLFWGPEHGGLTAYLNANELDPPPRFHYNLGGEGNFDYLSPLMGCWFVAGEIANFQPTERYITGKALIERWGELPAIQPEAYILAKIKESRLVDCHPIYGGTDATFSGLGSFPPLATGLFALSQVVGIEASDFGCDEEDSPLDNKMPGHINDQAELRLPPNEMNARDVNEANQDGSANKCGVFLAMENLTADEISIAFVGDKTDAGLGANNMLEISARKETRRVPLAALDLVDRRRGTPNSQGGILLGMVQMRKLFRTEANAKSVSRLRKIFYKHLGIKDDPFENYRASAGWEPRFKITDNRGAADERAKQEAERRTSSLEQLHEQGVQFAGTSTLDSSFDSSDCDESENDPAAEWLRDNDPDLSA